MAEHREGILATGMGAVSHHDLTVLVDEGPVTLSLAELEDAAVQGLVWLVNQGVAVSPPMRVTTEAPGGTLIKDFPAPLPEGWGAGFMTVDESTGEFRVVEAVLSEDRSSMTTQVEHFSNWWDFLTPNEIGETMRVGLAVTVEDAKDLGRKSVEALTSPRVVAAAEKIDYLVGGALTTRVDPPSCSGAAPSWVSDAVFIEQHFNNPIHFCAGSAPGESQILEVKVRINRGFGITVSSSAAPVRAANTTYSGVGDGVAAFASDVSQSIADGLGPVLEGGSFLGAGQEATLRFDEASVRSAGSGPLITVNAPNARTFAVGQLASVLTTAGLSLMDATTLAVAGVASCTAEMMRTDSAADAAFGSAKCGMTYLSENADQLVGATGGVLSRAALQRASLALTAGGAIHNYIAYQLSTGLEEGGRTVHIITAEPFKPVVEDRGSVDSVEILEVGAFTMPLPPGYFFSPVSGGPLVGVAGGPDGSPDRNPNGSSLFRVVLGTAGHSEGRYDTTWIPEECWHTTTYNPLTDERRVTIAGYDGTMAHHRYECGGDYASYSWVLWETTFEGTVFRAEYIWSGPDRSVDELTAALRAATWAPDL